MNKKQIEKILKENKYVFDSLAEYDQTRELPSQRKRIDITLSVKTINNLKKLKKKTGKPISKIIEERLDF
ncbi:MAG: hypothetical protein WC533_02800 [Candidatus Pacearchaeota archaeon]